MAPTRRQVLASAAAVAGTATLGAAGATPAGEWSTTFDDGNEEYVDAVEPLDDGYLVVGRSVADDSEHYWWLEIGPDGQQRASGRFERETDGWIGGVAAADDGGFLIAGVDSDLASTATWARRYGPDRDHLWSYDPGEDDALQPEGAVATGDGEFVVAGIVDPLGGNLRGETRRLAADGSLANERAYGEKTVVNAAARRPGGGVVIGGARGPTRDRSAWIVARDAEGGEDWQRTYEETPLEESVGGVYDLHVEDGTIAMAASVGSAAGVLVADAEGAVEWAEPVEFEQAEPTLARIDDGYVLGGSFVFADSSYEYFLANVGPDDGVRWASRYADGESMGDLLGAGGNVLFAGYDGRDAVVRTVGAESPPPGGEVTVADDGGSSDGESEGDGGMPGFGVGTAVAGLAGAGLLRRREE